MKSHKSEQLPFCRPYPLEFVIDCKYFYDCRCLVWQEAISSLRCATSTTSMHNQRMCSIHFSARNYINSTRLARDAYPDQNLQGNIMYIYNKHFISICACQLSMKAQVYN